jgi:transposase
LRELAQWLKDSRCEMAAMESTGSYWKPVFNILEGMDVDVIVVNAQHVRNVPGRKTDVSDAEWLAKLLSQGNLKPSFVPDREHRELREVTRYRDSLVGERAREINRLQKMLEGANIKLTSVVYNVMGTSARKLINASLVGAKLTEEAVLELVDWRLNGNSAALADAMDGIVSEVQRDLIMAVLDHIDDMGRRIADLDQIIAKRMESYDEAINRIDQIPGIGVQSAQTILAETGLDMTRFRTASNLAAWAGVCPGNNESAGKKKKSKTRKGNPTLKKTLVLCANSAIRTNGTFFRAQYDRLVVRLGKNRAKMAVAHSIIIAIWHMLKNGTDYNELGGDYYNARNPEKKAMYYIKKLHELGYPVSIPTTG